jgi:uncharacterized protein YndB with AHSA1/START domain
MAGIKHNVIITAPPAQVFAAVTEQAGLAAWWTPETIAQPELGAILEFKFGKRYHNKMELIALEPDRFVKWKCIKGDAEWVSTILTFNLTEKNGQTLLRFTHGEWEAETDFFATCNYHWGYYMRSLKLYCETGQGTPYPAE